MYTFSFIKSVRNVFRFIQPGYCTTSSQIDIVYERDGIEIGKESFVDSSCRISLIRMFKNYPDLLESRADIENWSKIINVVSLDSLANRITKQKTK